MTTKVLQPEIDHDSGYFDVAGFAAATLASAPALAAVFDHTLLKPEATRDQVVRLCEEAASFRFACAMVNPAWVSLAHSVMVGSGVPVGVVVGFPLGANLATTKREEAMAMIKLGAHELDMVMNIGALRSGDRQGVLNDIIAVAEVAHGSGAIVKVILETPLLTLEEKILSCQLSLAAKADFVKTATGFFGSATADDVSLMRGVVGDHAGVKASGGVRTAANANAMLDAGANRIGASASVAIVQELGAPEFKSRT